MDGTDARTDRGARGMSARAPTVLHLVPALDDGHGGLSVRELVRGLAAAGHRLFVAGGAGVAAIEFAGARVVEVELSASPLALWRAAMRLEALVRAEGVDLLHAHGELAAAVAHRLARRTRRPWVASLDDAAPAAARWLASLGLDGRAQADRVVVPSEDVAERLARVGEVPPARARVVAPAIDLERFDPARVDGRRRRHLRQRWGLAMDRPLVVLPGPVVRRGGHLELLRALKRVGRADALAVFAAEGAGDAAYRKQVELFARTAGMGAQMLFAELDDDRPAALALADVVALPTVETPPPAAPAALEAQAMGTPVVVHAIGALPEALMPAATGWLVEEGDVDGLAEALRLALAMPEAVRARTAERARAFVAEQFDARRVVAAVRDVYAELAPVTAS